MRCSKLECSRPLRGTRLDVDPRHPEPVLKSSVAEALYSWVIRPDMRPHGTQYGHPARHVLVRRVSRTATNNTVFSSDRSADS